MKDSKFRSLLYGVLPFLLVLALWSAVTYTGVVKSFFLPTPGALVRAMVDLFFVRGFLGDVGISIFRVFLGFLVAVVLAVPIGIWIGLSKKAEIVIEPLADFIRYIPNPALIPLFILWFGVGETEKVLVISQTVFFQLVLMVANSVSFTPRELLESARTLGASRWQVIRQVIYPFARPRIYDDLRVSLGWAWTALMAAEIVGATSGIGLVIVEGQRLLRTSNVMTGIVVVGTLGLVTDVILKRLYPVLFPWAPKLRGHA